MCHREVSCNALDCQKNTPEYLEKELKIIKELALNNFVLLRLDSGNGDYATRKPLMRIGNFYESPETAIQLYHDRGSSEQFYGELKSGVDFERFSPGKMGVNAILFAMIAFSTLRKSRTYQLSHVTVFYEDELMTAAPTASPSLFLLL